MLLASAAREAEVVKGHDGKWDVHLYTIKEGKGRCYLSTTRHKRLVAAERRAQAWVHGGQGDA